MSRTERHNWRGTVRDGAPGICPDGANCEICGKAAVRRANRRDRHQARAELRTEPADDYRDDECPHGHLGIRLDWCDDCHPCPSCGLWLHHAADCPNGTWPSTHTAKADVLLELANPKEQP